jgi:hypothetical protein
VDCVHWVPRDELPVLEHVMKNMGRINTGIMNSYKRSETDVFQAAAAFRAKKAEIRMAHRSWTAVCSGFSIALRVLNKIELRLAYTGRDPCTGIIVVAYTILN